MLHSKKKQGIELKVEVGGELWRELNCSSWANGGESWF